MRICTDWEEIQEKVTLRRNDPEPPLCSLDDHRQRKSVDCPEKDDHWSVITAEMKTVME